MKQRVSFFSVVALSSTLLMAGQVQAMPSYSFSVDRFEVTGQVAEADEFDNDVLVPSWVIVNPTVTESGGVVTLSSPGGIIAPNEQETELVTVFTSPFTVLDGSGDFTGASTWVTGLPGVNLSFEMTVNHNVPVVGGGFEDEFFSIGFTNLDPAIAASLGVPAGPVAFFARELGNFIDPQVLPINPANVTGNILLQLSFDDTNDLFSGAFSLDGGTSFQTFSTPLSPSAGEADYQWALMAGSMVPEPETYAMMLAGLGLVGFMFMARRRKALVA